jgi:sulfatase maturation enzyme AslB (radical SAM superfamily)
VSSSIGPIEAADIHLRRAAPSMWKAKHLEFVVKLSKFCNLRCSYCYEFEDLHKKDRMALEQIRSMFVNIFAHAALHDVKTIEFCWHGGEPFLFKPSFFREIGSSQATVFGTHVVVSNIVQTNLTVLSEEMLSFLEERSFFSGSVSRSTPMGLSASILAEGCEPRQLRKICKLSSTIASHSARSRSFHAILWIL